MGNLYESIKALCDERGIKPGKMCVDLGISKSLMTDLKSGKNKGITDKTATAIANYFGVTVDRVLGIKKAPSEAGGGATEDDLKFALFGGDGPITDAMWDEVKNFAAYVKEREKRRNDS